MSVPQVLLETVDNLIKNDLKKLKWIKPIHRELIDTYGDEMAVNVTAEVLKKLGRNNDAKELKNSYAETPAAPVAPPAAPAPPPAAPAPPPAASVAMMAQQGSIIIAPTVTGGTSGTWNITINK
ncbi:hypothetical protein VZT92_003156 [Zoarces viviparus]|uniref:Uncharacterized protein n=1 Tax=Zoarces viviparus TaxID=48416 RepID=A0AAW1G1J5_ZOAVI